MERSEHLFNDNLFFEGFSTHTHLIGHNLHMSKIHAHTYTHTHTHTVHHVYVLKPNRSMELLSNTKSYLDPLTPSSSSTTFILNSLHEKGSGSAVYKLFVSSYVGSLIPRSDSLYSLTSSAIMDLFTALEDTSAVILTYKTRQRQQTIRTKIQAKFLRSHKCYY